MNKVTTFVALVLAISAAAAWGADYVVESAPAGPEPTGPDGTTELKWDSGSVKWSLGWWTGLGRVVGNDFDISTISTYRGIKLISIFSQAAWPNGRWDGFRIAVYRFSGGVPGSLLWGPKLVVGSGSSGWKDFSVNWALPGGVNTFLASHEQYYNWPNCDPYALDNNPAFMGHSWMNTTARWQLYYVESVKPYRNLMVRVTVDDALEVAPTSLGRVKALYY